MKSLGLPGDTASYSAATAGRHSNGGSRNSGSPRPEITRKRSGKQTAETIGRRLLEIVVYEKCCRIGGKLTRDDLAEHPRSATGKCPTSGGPVRGVLGMGDRSGRYTVADHGGAGGGLTAIGRNGTFDRIRSV
jgi:hypothetical protein